MFTDQPWVSCTPQSFCFPALSASLSVYSKCTSMSVSKITCARTKSMREVISCSWAAHRFATCTWSWRPPGRAAAPRPLPLSLRTSAGWCCVSAPGPEERNVPKNSTSLIIGGMTLKNKNHIFVRLRVRDHHDKNPAEEVRTVFWVSKTCTIHLKQTIILHYVP